MINLSRIAKAFPKSKYPEVQLSEPPDPMPMPLFDLPGRFLAHISNMPLILSSQDFGVYVIKDNFKVTGYVIERKFYYVDY